MVANYRYSCSRCFIRPSFIFITSLNTHRKEITRLNFSTFELTKTIAIIDMTGLPGRFGGLAVLTGQFCSNMWYYFEATKFT